jgi:hypothetical protein
MATRRPNTWMMLAATAVAVVVAVALVAVGVVALTNYEGGKNVGSDLPQVQLPETPVAMLAAVDEDNVLASLTVLVLDPSGSGGSIVSIPVVADASTVAEVRAPLRAVYAEQGAEGLRLQAESVLNLTVDTFEVMPASRVAGLLAGVGGIPVTFEADVLDDSPARVIFEQGTASLNAREASQALAAYTPEQPDAVQRPTAVAVWAGVVEAVGSGVGEPPSDPAAASVPAFVGHLFTGPLASRGLPTIEIPEELNPDGIDVEQLDLAEAILVFAAVAPSAMSTPRDGLINRIVGPPGSEAKVKETIALLLFFGQNVVSVAFDGPDQEPTDIINYDERTLGDAEAASPLFGTVRFPEPTERVVGVDVVIVLGSDFLTQTVDPDELSPSSSSPDTVPLETSP